MADTIKTTDTFQLTCGYSDGSSNILLFDNANSSITAADVASLSSYIADNNLLLGNGDATFSAITDARIIGKKKTSLDIS